MSTPDNRNTTLVNNFNYQLSTSLSELGYRLLDDQIEAISIFLVRAMGSELRNYHKPEHSIDVSKDLPPVACIAALFHDVIYVQVDPQWKAVLNDTVSPVLPSENLSLNVKETISASKRKWFEIAAIVFGISQEENLQPMQGLNEFLSALVLISKMKNIFNEKDLIKAISCIEATIPFRKKDAEGNTPSKRLANRLRVASEKYNLNLTQEDISNISVECRSIVENDLYGFRSEKLSYFLSDSWNVLSENHQTLRNTFFLISDYRKAVFGLIGFFQMLDPENMFWNDVTPANPKSDRYTLRAKYNLKNGAQYMKAFYISLSLIEAIAIETGGDVPYEYFIGAKKTSREHTPPEISDFLPQIKVPHFKNEEDDDIYYVLLNGRQVRSKFDRKYCPLGAFLFHELTNANKFEHLYQQTLLFHKCELSGKEFINEFKSFHLKDILEAISNLAPNRAEKILSLL